MNKLSNEYCSIKYNEEEKEINGQDLKDQNNCPAFYSESKRGIEKAWKILESFYKDDTTMQQAINILYNNGVKIHSYCMMD
jgi:hypothetical protein